MWASAFNMDQILQFLCWYDACVNSPAVMVEATSPSAAAEQYRKLHPEAHHWFVYVRLDKLGPLHQFG